MGNPKTNNQIKKGKKNPQKKKKWKGGLKEMERVNSQYTQNLKGGGSEKPTL